MGVPFAGNQMHIACENPSLIGAPIATVLYSGSLTANAEAEDDSAENTRAPIFGKDLSRLGAALIYLFTLRAQNLEMPACRFDRHLDTRDYGAE